jgi:hypothetical protein
MSKAPLTISVIKQTIQPLITSIDKLSESQETCNTQVSELYNMLISLSVKLDTFDQKTGVQDTSVKKPPAKKTAKKPPAKKGEMKQVVDDEYADDESDKDSVSMDSDKKKVVKKTIVKKPLKTGADEPTDDPVDSEEDTSYKNTPIKKTIKKTRTKKAPVEKKERMPNKMEYFNKMYDSDETYFDSYIKETDKQNIRDNNVDAWEGLDTEALRKATRAALYHYMKDTHDVKLQFMKAAYIEDLKNKKLVLVSKEPDE